VLSNTIPLEQREYTPVEMEVAKSVKQESRHFSDERFKEPEKIEEDIEEI